MSQMKSVSTTPAPGTAFSAQARLCPASIPHDIKSIFPALQKIIFVDISLNEVFTKTGTGGNGTVNKHRSYINSRFAEHEVISNFLLIVPQKAVTTTDSSDRQIREIDPVSNTVLRTSSPLNSVPVSITIESFQNAYLLAASSSEEGTVERVTLSTFYVTLSSSSSDITAAPAESIRAVVHPEWFAENGSVSICSNYSAPEIFSVPVAGHPTNICSVPGSTLFYALSYLGDGTSRITAINYFTKEIIAKIDIPGFPWDITSHANGEYILTLTSDI